MARAAARAFTLMELMVVVIIVGVLTVMAIPTMAEARLNARTLDDATKVAELYREGRTRAMGRGAAMLLTATSANGVASTDLGTFSLYEAQIWGTTKATALLPLPGGSPVSSCGAPIANYWATVTNAANAPSTLMDQVNLNSAMEVYSNLWTTLADNTGSNPTQTSLCFTPLGKTYYQAGTVTPTFTPGVNLLHGALQITVQRSEQATAVATGLRRTVIVPDSGSTRIISR